MKVELNINEDVVRVLFDVYCDDNECHVCGCQDPYGTSTCYNNYKNGIFKTLIQEKFDIMCELIKMR